MKIAAQLTARPTSSEERPLELLHACHDKIRRFTTLTERIAAHIEKHGGNVDAEAREAAESVLRYFEQALPLHHADEEVDVFPALRTLQDEALTRSIVALDAEHVALNTHWQAIAPWLRQVVVGSPDPKTVPSAQTVAEFAAAYRRHVEREEREAFSAIERLPAEVAQAVAARMRARRGA